jgi:cobalt-zinc-cadmium resistance protein CzcA
LRDTKISYISLAYLYEKNTLYQKQDSIFGIFKKIANTRQKTGETSKLEYLNIEQKAKEIQFLYNQNQQEIALSNIQLQKNIYTNDNFKIENLKNIKLIKPDTTKKLSFALLEQKKQVIDAQKKYTNWQKSLLSPDLRVGYYTMQEGEDRNKNLHVVQLGVAVPIFNQAQKKRVEESKILEQITEQQYKNTETQATFDLNFIVKQYEKQKLALDYYENEQLPRLRDLEKLAQTAYKNGETGYFEVLQVQFSVFNAEMLYIQELNMYLNTLVHWQYLTGELEN